MRPLPEGHEELVRLLRAWGDGATIQTYLNLMRFILVALGLPNGDARLVTNTRKVRDTYLAPVTLGMRYILAFHRPRDSVFLILPRGYEIGHPLFERTGHFDALSGELDVPPAWGLTRNLSAIQGSPQVLNDWMAAARAEILRQTSSTFRRHHKPAVYAAACDPQYRDVVLDQAFGEDVEPAFRSLTGLAGKEP